MITPKQAKEMTASDLEFAKTEERRIDDLLRGFEDKQIVSLPREMSRKVREHLKDKYTEAGWSVVFRGQTQCDEPCFEFTIPSPPRSYP